MELKTILGYLQEKTILVTGATGFLAMVFLEKILRVQPDVKKVYLLLRAPDTNSANDRMHNEIIGKALFKVLREKLGADFDSFISEKVVAVPGDVTSENLGVKDFTCIMYSTYTVSNCIYDIALDVNTFGVLHVLSFAMKCILLEMLLHVSTGQTIDSVIAAYCKGKLTCLLVDPMSVFDMIPVDMVVNSIISAMVVNANQSSIVIYHVRSSFGNPIQFCDIHNFVFRHFTKSPWVNKDGNAVKVGKCTMFRTMASFRMYMQICFMIPLQGLKFVSKASGGYFQDMYVNNIWKLTLVMRLVELYKRYMLFKGIYVYYTLVTIHSEAKLCRSEGGFDDNNSEELQKLTSECYIDAKEFNFDPKCIDWEDYFMNTHIPGLRKHVMVQ
ncbi:unnamed protein product [Malus baccata var. baccata]